MLKIGVVGAGHLGKIHLRCIRELKEYSLEGLYDTDKTNAASTSSEFGIRNFEKLEDLIDHCDVIDIVTPTISHYDVAVGAIRASKHIFIEKPVTETPEQAAELCKLVSEANVKAQVGHVERYNPAFLAARPFIKNPMFIETHRLAEFNPRGTDVPVVLDLMIHDIDIVLSQVRSTVKKINASGVAVVSDSPDIANARIEFDNGCVANLTASRISLKNMRKMRIFQRDAYVSLDFLEKNTEIIRMEDLDSPPDDDMAMLFPTPNGKYKRVYFENPDIPETNAIREELRSLANSINKNTPVDVSLEDGRSALQLAYEIVNLLERNESLVKA